MLAEIVSVYARKGNYYYAADHQARGITWSAAASSLLSAIDAQRRYEALSLPEGAERVRRFIEGVQGALGFSGDPLEAAIAHLSREAETTVASAVSRRDIPDLVDHLIEMVDWAFESALEGAHSTAVPYFQAVSETFRRHGFDELAKKHAARAEEELRLARLMRLVP
jgi:hypothetical protein